MGFRTKITRVYPSRSCVCVILGGYVGVWVCLCVRAREKKRYNHKGVGSRKKGQPYYMYIGFSIFLTFSLTLSLSSIYIRCGSGVEKFLMTRLGFLFARAPPNLTLMLFISVGIIRVYIRASATAVSFYLRIEYIFN